MRENSEISGNLIFGITMVVIEFVSASKPPDKSAVTLTDVPKYVEIGTTYESKIINGSVVHTRGAV